MVLRPPPPKEELDPSQNGPQSKPYYRLHWSLLDNKLGLGEWRQVGDDDEEEDEEQAGTKKVSRGTSHVGMGRNPVPQ